MTRRLADDLFHVLKGATRDLIRACGGLKRAAGIVGVSEQTLSRYQLATFDDTIPLTAVLALEADCGLAPVTAAMASINGRALAEGEQAGLAAACLVQRHSEVMREASDVMARFAEVVSDGQISPGEAEQVERELGDLVTAAGRFRADLAAVKASGGLSVFNGGKR